MGFSRPDHGAVQPANWLAGRCGLGCRAARLSVLAISELSGETRGENMEPTSAALTEQTQAVPAANSVALAKTYGVGQAAVHALAGIMVTFDRGRFTAVMGPS